MRIIKAKGALLDLVEAIENAQAKIYRYSGRKGVTRISVDPEFGLNNGLIPGTCAILWTSCGPVELYCERRLDLEYEQHPMYDPPQPPSKEQLAYLDYLRSVLYR